MSTTTRTQVTDNAARFILGGMASTITLADLAAEFGADIDLEAADAEYRRELAALLPAGWDLARQDIYRTIDATEPTEQIVADIREAAALVDGADILARHAR